ncbi:MAG: pilus assembly protein [Acidobacteria bacterium]|nr:pilus assembly protein [Acidobacteriota bacterium]MBI3278662.1 pilus assembly protein [Acidobacteriota bacterium]
MADARRGNAVLEFAISVCLIVPLITGIFQYGYSFYVYNKLQSAVRAGSRYASLRTYDSNSSTPSESFLAAIRNVTIYNSPAGGGDPVVIGLTPSHVDLTVTMNNNVPQYMTVKILNFQIDAIFSTVNFNGKPLATFPYMGRQAP